MYEKKMKLAKYITIAVNVLIFFIACWIINSVAEGNSVYICIAAGVVAIIAFTINTLSLFGFSIKLFISSFKDWKSENGLWKILNLVFKLLMFLFAILITIFWLVWLIYILKDGFGTVGSGLGALIFKNKFEQFGYYSYAYINGGSTLDYLAFLGIASKAPYGLFITSFVFILIWSASGIAFEIVKKVLGGNRPSKKEETHQQA